MLLLLLIILLDLRDGSVDSLNVSLKRDSATVTLRSLSASWVALEVLAFSASS
jgi:hypothetical protein